MAARRKQKTSPTSIGIAERRKKALAMRLQRWGYTKIAEVLGISVSTAFEDVLTALKEIPKDEADRLREAEKESLDGLEARLWRAVDAGDTSAADKILRVKERRARMLGLDAPASIAFEGEPLRVVLEYVSRNGNSNPEN
jgi:hypothetical protein